MLGMRPIKKVIVSFLNKTDDNKLTFQKTRGEKKDVAYSRKSFQFVNVGF